MKRQFAFGAWEPDRGPEGPHLLTAMNVVPHPGGGYAPLKQLAAADSVTATTTATPTNINGAFAAIDRSGSDNIVFVGSANKLWACVISNGPWLDRSRTTAYAAHVNWTFARYGDYVIAANFANPPQKSSLGSGASQFLDLGGSPPQAVFVGVVRDFVVFARLSTGDPTELAALEWSALGNAEDYTASATTQSDTQVIADEGPILGFVGGEYGLIFFRNAVYRMVYIGSPVIFQFDKIASGFEFAVSSLEGDSANHGYQTAKFGDDVYFISTEGLSVIRAGQALQHISRNRNGRFFRENCGQSGSGQRFLQERKMLAVDHLNSRVIMAWNPPGVSAGAATQMIYDIPTDRFTQASLSMRFVITGIGRNVSLSATVNTALGPGEPLYFSTNSRLFAPGSVDAANLTATIETADIDLLPGQRAFVNAVRPYVNHAGTTGAPMVQVGTKNKHNQSISYSGTVTVNGDGETPQRAAGRRHRFLFPMSVSATWSSMHGFEVSFSPDGQR